MAPIANRTPHKQRRKEYRLIGLDDDTMQRNGKIKYEPPAVGVVFM